MSTETAASSQTLLVSIVVPWCGEQELFETLRVLGSDSWFEIIVVDNRRHPVASSLGPFPRLVHEAVPGAAAARNRGFRESQGEFILFLDADCVPQKGWVVEMLQRMNELDADGLQGPILSRQKEAVARYIQAEFDQRQNRLARYGRISLVSTGNCAFRRQVLETAGGFDTSLVAGEDTEFSFRLQGYGYQLFYATSPPVWHRHPIHVLTLLRRKFRYGFYLARVYRRYRGRIAENTRTPRTQLLAIGSWVALFSLFLIGFWQGGLVFLGLLMATALPLVRKGGLLALLLFPLCTLMNTAGLLSGWFWPSKPAC
jgi:cellulose synthase/poly-beta-1,6-N-acetylglucosamine synthase-like glycosyltransferase